MRYAALFAAFAWIISLTPPASVKAGEQSPLHASVTDEKSKPVKGASVEMIVTMVDMDHGEFKHQAKESAPGGYDAKAQFLMAGTWNVKVRVTKAGQSAAQDFKIKVSNP